MEKRRYKRQLFREKEEAAEDLIDQLTDIIRREIKIITGRTDLRFIYVNLVQYYFYASRRLSMNHQDATEKAADEVDIYREMRSTNPAETVHDIILDDLLDNFNVNDYEEILTMFLSLSEKKIYAKLNKNM